MNHITIMIGAKTRERIGKAKARKAFEAGHDILVADDNGCNYKLFASDAPWWDRASFDDELDALEQLINHKLRHPAFFDLVTD